MQLLLFNVKPNHGGKMKISLIRDRNFTKGETFECEFIKSRACVRNKFLISRIFELNCSEIVESFSYGN